MFAGTEPGDDDSPIEAEINSLRLELLGDFEMAWKRYFATGRMPEGCVAPCTGAPAKLTLSKEIQKQWMLGDLARTLSKRYFGEPGVTWNYEIQIINGRENMAGLVVTRMDYCGSRSANVRDINSGRLWTGGRS